ncbi:hypothetical protein H6P81_010618 [Aristolochia fimbriata]|uniref:TBCC domain-containing protein 1 n=1 Tax=Aristolochia fimbriata TaxID=158543 RepID=A0AAV7EPA0_ARIFI|nr:hypothetical protein H6P81_010618 [Aristolochia fimbriata]
MNDGIETSTSSASAREPVSLRARREPFEYGLLPISKLIFSDGAATLAPLKQKLIQNSPSSPRIDAATISETLQISPENARLVLDTLAAVLPSDTDPLVTAGPAAIDAVGADINDLILFLYIQSYKRLLPRSHKDAVAVADVWPTTSAFDGYLSALSPLQLVRSNSRRFMPSQADEEAHQLSYLQKHLGNILALLAEPAESEDEESLVLTVERFEHLGFLIQFGEKGSARIPLSQAASFFANSDPDMPAVPVPATQVHDWILQHIAVSLEQTVEKTTTKDNGPVSGSDVDVTMADASVTQPKSQNRTQTTYVEGISKTSLIKNASEVKGSSIKVINCHDSVIYVLAPLRYATVYGCSDATIVLGAIGRSVRVEHCERVHVITATKRICIANCRECVFFLGVNQRPLILGDNHKLQVAPYNTFYPQLEDHMAQVGVDAEINQWDQPLVLGMVDPHDSLSHSPGVSDVQAESATCLEPDQFTNFLIPNWFGAESTKTTKCNPFLLPEAYMTSQRKNQEVLIDLKQALREVHLEDSKKRELASALHVYFKDWLYTTGNIRQLYCLQGD